MKLLKTIIPSAVLGLASLASVPAYAAPGCEGKMWNPITDIDFTLMGSIRVAGATLLKGPKDLGNPPNHKSELVCFCKDGLNTGFGVGIAYWLPTHVVDVSRQGGCIGFLNGTNILPMFISLSSSQESTTHSKTGAATTNMQIHKATADIVSIAGKSIFEKCGSVKSGFSVDYLTEVDFVFQNDVYSAIMSPQVALLAATPLLSQLSCDFQRIRNELGGWSDIGVCGWNGIRYPLSANTIGKDSAQVTNMEVMLKYMTRSAMMGTLPRTMGSDAVCKPQASFKYDPFQHRYQWSYPTKTSTRYNHDVIRWGLFSKGGGNGDSRMKDLGERASQLASSVSSAATAPGTVVERAKKILEELPRPLNYPTREAGYMQVWEAKQCCLKVVTVNSILQNLATSFIPAGELKKLYELYNTATKVYNTAAAVAKFVKDPIGGALGFISGKISSAISGAFSSGLKMLSQYGEGLIGGSKEGIAESLTE